MHHMLPHPLALHSSPRLPSLPTVSSHRYVEKRLLQDRLQALESEIGQRDQLEGAIDDKMLALFSRLKALEDANLRLEQENEEIKAKVPRRLAETEGQASSKSDENRDGSE